jgi:hypothetical protein
LFTKALLASLEPKRNTYRPVPVEIKRTLVLFGSKECSNVWETGRPIMKIIALILFKL